MNQTDLAKEIANLANIVYRVNRSVIQCRGAEDLNGISGIQFQTMITLLNSDILNMTELADMMMMTRQQLTKVIDALVEKGFVIRESDPNNRKHVMIRVSDCGEKYMREIMLSRPNILSRLITTLSEEDSQKFFDAIIAIREVLEKVALTQAK